MPLAAGNQSNNSQWVRTLSHAVGALEQVCLQAWESEVQQYHQEPGLFPCLYFVRLVCQHQSQSGIPQGHNMAAEAPEFTTRCHHAQRQKKAFLSMMILS